MVIVNLVACSLNVLIIKYYLGTTKNKTQFVNIRYNCFDVRHRRTPKIILIFALLHVLHNHMCHVY